jgi:hypothetical protein
LLVTKARTDALPVTKLQSTPLLELPYNASDRVSVLTARVNDLQVSHQPE